MASAARALGFRGGHDLGLTVGASESSFPDYSSTSTRGPTSGSASRARCSSPFRLWLYGEYEISTGDDFEGDRLLLEIAYRF